MACSDTPHHTFRSKFRSTYVEMEKFGSGMPLGSPDHNLFYPCLANILLKCILFHDAIVLGNKILFDSLDKVLGLSLSHVNTGCR